MKIALIIEHFDPTRGGAEAVAVWIAAQLAARGHDVHVLCHDVKRRMHQRYHAATQGASHEAHRSARAHGISEDEIPPGVHLHRFSGLQLSTGIGFRVFGTKARNWCRAHQPDVAHSLTVAYAADIYHPEAGVYARMQQQAVASRSTAAAAGFKRFLQQLNGKQRTLLALECKAVRSHSDGGPYKIISISAGMSRELADHYGLSPDRLFFLPNPPLPRPSRPTADTTPAEDRVWFRKHYRLADADKVALFVGHDFRRKGLRYAILAVAQTSDWKLVVVGLGKAREYVDLVHKLGLADRVLFVGPTREVHRLYHAGDVLLLPVFYDPAPLVVVEALAAGVPVISTRHLGSCDLIETHHAGTIVPEPRDTAALAAALTNLPADPAARAALAERCRAAATPLTPENFMTQLLALYTECQQSKTLRHP